MAWSVKNIQDASGRCDEDKLEVMDGNENQC